MTWAWTKVVDLDTGSSGGQAAAAYGEHGGKLYFRMDLFPGYRWRVWDPASPSSFTELAVPGGGYDVDSAGGGCWGNDGYFYLGGGVKPSFAGNSKQWWRYDPGGDTWTQKADMPDSCIYTNCAAWGTDIYQFGNDDGTPYQKVWRYDTVGDSWTNLGSILPAQRGDGICCVPVVGTGIYLWGGYNLGTDGQNAMTLFDPTGPTFTDLTPSPTPLFSGQPGAGPFTGQFSDGTIPFYHGSNSPNNGTWLYDPSGDSWTQVIANGADATFDSDVYTSLMPAGMIGGDWYVLGFASIWKLAGPVVASGPPHEGWGVRM